MGTGVAMLGEKKRDDDKILFTPLVPFTPNLDYEIVFRGRVIRKVKIPRHPQALAAAIISVYPSTDTVPENLLKIYLGFSAAIREGEALKHVFLLDGENDTLSNVFLDLQPELWNEERTVLTLWLDPGRIKRGLIPNEQMALILIRLE